MMDAAIVLRSVFQKNEKGWLQVWAGIVKNSSPEREMEETREKVRSIAQFLVSTDWGESKGSTIKFIIQENKTNLKTY